MDMRAGAFRISYMNSQRECYRNINAGTHCPEAYDRASLGTLKNLTHDDEGLGPDLVVFEVAGTQDVVDFSFLEELKTAIGQDWTGAAVAVYRPHSPDVPWIVDGLDVYPGVPNSLRSFSRGSAIGFVELSSMALPMLGTLAELPSQGISPLWHRKCQLAGMHSCFLLGDMEFQLLYDYASQLKNGNRLSESIKQLVTGVSGDDRYPETIEFCMQCPGMGGPELQCFDHLPA